MPSLEDFIARLMGSAPAQPDATRAPSGMTQKLGGDVTRKVSVLADDFRDGDTRSLIEGSDESLANRALARAFWGRTPIGKDPTRADIMRDENVNKVGASLDKTRASLDSSKAVDRSRRNK